MKKGKTIIWFTIGILVIGLIVIACFWGKEHLVQGTPLLELEEYKEIKKEDIKQITIMKYQESGVESILETSKKDINATYNYLSHLGIGKETDSSCDDNTTIYMIELKEKTINIEIECDNLVQNNKRYQIKK